MGRFVDSLIAYRILVLLVTPFENTEAFRRGIIDAKGKELKKMMDLKSVEDRDAYTLLHRLVYRIKRIIEKVPIENKKIVSLAAAYSLIKEHLNNNKEPINLEEQYLHRLDWNLSEEITYLESVMKEKKMFTFKTVDNSYNVLANNSFILEASNLPYSVYGILQGNRIFVLNNSYISKIMKI